MRFVTVNYGGWDHHAKIFDEPRQEAARSSTAACRRWSRTCTTAACSTDTLVVCMGEFGRTPKINKDAGRDHWGPAGVAAVRRGRGEAGVRARARPTSTGRTRRSGRCRPADVAYTIFDALGIDPRKQLDTPDGRPIEILDQGDTVKELFA